MTREETHAPDSPTTDTPSAGPVFSARIIASLLMVTQRRLQQLVVDGWIPRAERGRYSLRESVRGYIDSLKSTSAKKRARTRRRPVERTGHAPEQSTRRALRLADAALAVLAGVDGRCMAVDGPVMPTCDAITDEELRAIARHLTQLSELLRANCG